LHLGKMQRWYRRNSWNFGGFEKLTWQYRWL
jgi:hypothetical protein